MTSPILLDFHPDFRFDADEWLSNVEFGHCPFIPELHRINRKEYRQRSIQRFLEKRKHLNWSRRITYHVRSRFAKVRPRVGGRFVKINKENAPPPKDPMFECNNRISESRVC